MKRSCPTCGKKYKRISTHISQSSCEYDNFSDRQHQIITGIMMGDGSVSKQDKGRNPFLTVKSIKREFLKWFQDQFPLWSGGIRLDSTAEERALQHEKTGFNKNVNRDNYHDVYVTRINCHPGLNDYRRWYDTGKIKYPDNIQLTPLTTKIWYCSDGTLEKRTDSRDRVCITTKNESHRPHFLNKLFKECGFESNVSGKQIYFRVDESERLLKWMGEPLPGFEYKWN